MDSEITPSPSSPGGTKGLSKVQVNLKKLKSGVARLQLCMLRLLTVLLPASFLPSWFKTFIEEIETGMEA